MSELSEEQKFSRENFRGLIKIRENRESFLTVKLLSFTVYIESIESVQLQADHPVDTLTTVNNCSQDSLCKQKYYHA